MDEEQAPPGMTAEVPLQSYLELQVKHAVTEAFVTHRDLMRGEFATVLTAVNDAKVQNASEHAATTTTLGHIKATVDGMEPRVTVLEGKETTRTATERSREKGRDWGLRVVLGIAAVGGLIAAVLH